MVEDTAGVGLVELGFHIRNVNVVSRRQKYSFLVFRVAGQSIVLSANKLIELGAKNGKNAVPEIDANN